jgi:CheY-like chemotaxis protein
MNHETFTILLVDDSDNDVELMRAALRRIPVQHRLFTVSDGEEAVAYLRGTNGFRDRTRFPFPDLMLLDLKMPRLSGFEVLEFVRSTHKLPGVLIYVLTSSGLDDDIERAYSLGASGYLVKPGPFEQLVAKLDSLLRFYEVVERP